MQSLALAFLLALALPAQAPTALKPAAVAAIDALFAPWNKPSSPGCVVGVFAGGRVIHARAYGAADLERGVALAPDSVFDLASTSKQFFACAILLLEQDGKLTLDDDIRRHLPAFPDHGTPITIRHLLHHTSGIRDYLVLMQLAGMEFGNDHPEAEILALIARQKALNFTPGAEHLYSNSGYFLLAEIIRKVTGATPGDFLRARIFAPLGMTGTDLYDDHDRIVKRRAIGYSPAKGGGFTTELYRFDLVGDGGVLSNLQDLARWDANFAANKLGGGAALIETMLTRGALSDGRVLDYACALRHLEHCGQRAVDHGGAWAGYRSQMVRFPALGVTVAVLANLGTFDPDSKALAVADIVLADKLAPVPVGPPVAVEAKATASAAAQPDAAALAAFAGSFRSSGGRVFAVSFADGRLHLPLTAEQAFPLVATGPATFVAEGAPVPIAVEFVDGGKALQMKVADQPARKLTRIEPWQPSADDLAALTGAFRSDELDATWRLTPVEGGLRVDIGYREDVMRLGPSVQDEFNVGGATVRLARKDGKITGFTVDAGRVRGIGFRLGS